MNKKFKKVISSLLVLSFVLTYIPMDIVLANYQSLVTSMSIANRTPKGSRTSVIDVSWSQPTTSTKEDTSASDGKVAHTPEGYNIYYRNGTKREAYNTNNMKNHTDTTQLTDTINAPLADNSIYSFYVDPYHTHQSPDINKGSYLAPKEPGTIVESLNLTDITVSSESVNGGFKLTWGNPTYMGSNVFNGYILYYVPQTSSSNASINTNTAPSITMKLDDKDVVYNADGTVTYTFETSNVVVGQKYSLKIEPLYNNSPIRLSTSTSKIITVNGKDYQFAHTDSTTHEFRYDGAYVKPSLYIREEGTDKVRLYWNPISSASGSTVRTIEIFSYINDDPSQEVLIGTLAGTSATSINNWLVNTPDTLTSYKIVITYSDGTKMESNKAYYDPAFNDFDPYKPIIHKVVPDTSSSISNFTMFWQAFLRKPYNDVEESLVIPKYKNLYNDTELSYKIWVTDDLNNLDDNYFQQYYILDDQASSFKSSDLTVDGKSTLAYSTNISQYYTYENGEALLKNIEGNKIYYIKILATRNGTLEKSEEEYYSIYFPPTGDLTLTPLTMGTPPLRIAKDENGAEIVTDKTIDITWDKLWFEVYDEVTEQWYSVVGKDDNGNIVFGKAALSLENKNNILELYSPFDTSQTLETAKTTINAFLGVNDIPTRKMDISTSKYEIFTVQYNYLEEQGGYETYLETIKDSELWQPVTGTGTNPKFTVSTEQAPNTGNLSSNTAYVVYMRTYTLDSEGNRVYAYNPSYVVGNTTETPGDLVIVPPAQIIEAVSSTSSSVTFRWEYDASFTYKFKYSFKITDYPAGGIEVPHETLLADGELRTVNDKTYLYYTIESLFPETVYYGWVNATNGKNVSDWSTPASIQTLVLETPVAPKGLGPMGSENVKVINDNNQTSYTAIAEDYIIIEWTRLFKDTEIPESGISNDDKDYGDEILLDSYITNTYGVKFNNLNANERYYFRVKSRIIATKNEDGTAQIGYNYIISMADNEDFLDAREFQVPFNEAVDNGVDVIIKESEWSSTVSLVTGKSDSEYDGDFDPNLYPLPETDYELIYDSVTGELTYVFRGPGVDSTGKPNNGSDQRFISKVINDKIYDFSVDLTKYNGINVPKSKVEIPYSIITALQKQKVTLTFKTDNMYTKINLNTFSDAVKQQKITGLNKNTKAIISFEDKTNLYGLLGTGQSYVSTPQSVSLKLVTDNRTAEINTLQTPINVALAIDNRFLAQDKNVGMYKQVNGNTANWTPTYSKYNSANNKFYYDTKNTGTFTVISKDVPVATNTGSTSSVSAENALYSVNSAINITDLTYFNPSTLITANQFNNIVWAVANNGTSVAMNKTLDQTAYTGLGRAKLLVSGSYVTREKGLASIARLYELKTKEAVAPVSKLSEQGYSDYAKVDSAYSQGVNKAIDIGLVSGSTIRPKDNMTLGEFMTMIEAVVLDQK